MLAIITEAVSILANAVTSSPGQEIAVWGSGVGISGVIGYFVYWLTQRVSGDIRKLNSTVSILAESITLFLIHSESTSEPIRRRATTLQEQLAKKNETE